MRKIIVTLSIMSALESAQARDQKPKCSVFPKGSAWNTDISKLPVHKQSDAYIKSMGASKALHPDFGAGLYEGRPLGIPYVMVTGKDRQWSVDFTEYPEESDQGFYTLPPDMPLEGTAPGQYPDGEGDQHAIAVDMENCRLYELYQAFPPREGEKSWRAANGAIFDLRSQANPPRVDDGQNKIGWTSADAAGLPIFPGLVRYDEVAKGEINHALRFTAARTQKGFIFPATHWASHSTDPNRPPMGLRLRLKADFDITSFSPRNQVILKALKKYGMLLADNGSDWFISGSPHDSWNNDELRELARIKGNAFEAVDTGNIVR